MKISKTKLTILSYTTIALSILSRLIKKRIKISNEGFVKKRPNFPDKVMIQTTSLCNSDCIMCPYGETSKIQEQGKMNDELYRKIINECSKYKVERILMYLMNEPLMDKEIVWKINYAKEKNPNTIIHIVSNGNLLNKELSKQIIDSKIDYIEFSIHGVKENTYNKIMRKLDFKKTIKNIEEFYKLAKKAGKDDNYINIKFLKITGVVSQDEIDKVTDFWREIGIKRINYSEEPISRAGNVKWMKKITKKEVSGCKSIWRNEMIHILFNGQVIPCCMDWKREENLGNVNTKSIKEIWNGKKYKDFEDRLWRKKYSGNNFICKRCEESIKE